MYTPRAFVETDLARLDTLVEEFPFVTLLTTDDEGAPAVTPQTAIARNCTAPSASDACERIEMKFKLDQNHPEANRRAVADALRGRHDANADAAADPMQARDP